MSSRFIYVRGTQRSLVLRIANALLKAGLLVCAIAVLAVILFITFQYYPTVKGWVADSCAIAESSSADDFRMAEPSVIYDEDNNLILKCGEQEATYIEFNDLPKDVVNAFVAIEDKRFWLHHGVDWLSTAKAALLLVTESDVTRGGSTITQQLARNVYLTFEQSYERKVREIALALALEKKYSKEQIIEFYVNNINFGNGYCGIGAASYGYFGKDVSELSLGEVAFLCTIPNNPTYYNPLTNYNNTVDRQQVILREMLTQGYVTAEQCETALNEPIILTPMEAGIYEDYAASYALYCTVHEFMKRDNFEFEYQWDSESAYEAYCDRYAEAYETALREFRSGGYTVRTSLSLERQQSLLSIVSNDLDDFQQRNDGGYVVQGALTVVDNYSGSVIAVIGGREEPETTLALNRAFQSYRQPASAIKPLVVYTPALENGYNADTMVSDRKFKDGPNNAGNVYRGSITLRRAVEVSSNVVAWQIFEELTPQVGLEYLTDMQFSKVVPDDYANPSAIGGMTYGVTTVEMAAAYSSFANSGIWCEPTCVLSITDSTGRHSESAPVTKAVYDEDAVIAMTDILKGVAVSGTAKGLRLANGNDFACKTGTSNDNKVAWFCGYTQQYSVAVYVGADDNTVSIEGLSGSTYPEEIWRDVEDYLLAGEDVLPVTGVMDYDKMQSTGQLE